jgi:hypothetical protein
LHPIRTAGKSFIGEPIDMEYSPENKIIVKAHGNQTLPIDRLLEFQGNLKRLTKKNREKLMTSILEKGFIAPIFVWDDAGEYRLLDGHQRLKTLLWMRERGWDIPMLPVDIIEADDEQDAKKKLLAISSQYGEFTTEGYAEFINDIEVEDCVRLVDGEWAIKDDKDDELYTNKIEAPIYEITGECPDIKELCLVEKTNALIKEIEKAQISEEEKTFLRLAAQRHNVFSYSKIAEYYAHANEEMQGLMEKSALVIIDFDKAVENGYTRLSQKIISQYEEEYEG